MKGLARLFLLAAVAVAASAAPPERIISAAPSITEMLYALGMGERVVGVTTFCHYPPEVRDKPKIGTYMTPNLESVLALKPDLAIVRGDDPMAKGEADAGALAHLLGGKQRIKDAAANMVRNTGAIVRHPHLNHVFSFVELG